MHCHLVRCFGGLSHTCKRAVLIEYSISTSSSKANRASMTFCLHSTFSVLLLQIIQLKKQLYHQTTTSILDNSAKPCITLNNKACFLQYLHVATMVWLTLGKDHDYSYKGELRTYGTHLSTSLTSTSSGCIQTDISSKTVEPG